MKNDLDEVPWHLGTIFETIDDQYYFWNKVVGDIINEHLPVKKMRVKDKDVPYMTSESKKAIRQKRKFARKFAKERSTKIGN